jgi:hypothetical protein
MEVTAAKFTKTQSATEYSENTEKKAEQCKMHRMLAKAI